MMESEETNGILDYNAPPPQPVGIYGWRKRCLYAFVLVLMLVVIMNLALTVWILRVLDFSLDGMGKLKIVPKGFELQGEAEFLKPVYVNNIKSKKNKPLYVQSGEGIKFLASKDGSKFTNASEMSIGGNNIEVVCDQFVVQDSKGNQRLFINENKVELGSGEVSYPGDIRVKGSIKAPNIKSPEGEPLEIMANKSKVYITGWSGINMKSDGGDVTIKSQDNIYIDSVPAGTIHIVSQNIYLKGIPKARMSSASLSSSAAFPPFTSRASTSSPSSLPEVFQLCLCKNGKVFLALPNEDCRSSSKICGS